MNEPINDQIKEQLSALMDGELPAEQARFLQRRLDADADLRGRWARWHACREALQGRPVAWVDGSLVERVAARLQTEATPRPGTLPGVLRWVAGAAVAASVAVAALVALPQLGAPDAAQGEVAAPAAPADAPVLVADSGLRDSDLRPSLAPALQSVSAVQGTPQLPVVQIDPRVDGWLLRHNAATLRPMHDSFVPYIPVVSPYRPPYGQVVLDTRGGQP